MEITETQGNEKRKILITAGLPYANGPIHLGHLMEYLQADFWSRFQRLRGHDCHYICAEDTHGTPIMVKAREQNITPETLIGDWRTKHVNDFADFQVQFAHYGSTNSVANQKLCEEFYHALNNKGHFNRREIDQLYCEHDKMFLPDRFIKGQCPNCKSPDQYGDNCDVCGATYSTNEVIAPYCVLCRNKPVMKSSEHLFFRLNDYKSFLTEWIPNHTSPDVAKKMMEWFKEDLRDWDISRDKPYFGFPIPGTNGEKYFYVWVDAPMGYVSSTAEWAEKTGSSFNDFWRHSVDTEVYHFIGKDIAYFHLLFWPAFLKGAGFRLPDKVFVHGHLMVNGEKMSKSKGTFISARTYLDHLNPEYLRYYYASKLSAPVHDLDLNLEDFVARVNSDLVGKITNLASRGAQMLKKRLDGKIGSPDGHGYQLIENAQNKSETIAEYFEAREFSKAINEIRLIADEANKYFDERAPWKTIDSDPEGTRQVLTTTLNLFRIIAIYLQPILPHYAERVAELLNETSYEWDHLFKILTQHEIRDYAHLATRIDPVQVQKMVEASKPKDEPAKPAGEAASKSSSPKTQTAPAKPSSETSNDGYIDIDDFMKVDLRVGKIIEAQEVPEADKLLKLKVELSPTDHRQIFAGIKSAYKAETLVGRQVLVVANLRPRKMKFGMSEGMICAASDDGKGLFVLSPDPGAATGSRVK